MAANKKARTAGDEVPWEALEEGGQKAVSTWLDRGGSVDAQEQTGNSLLMIASKNGHLSVVQLLLKHKASLELQVRGCTALWQASAHGHEKVVNILLKHGASLGSECSEGCTELMIAASGGHPHVVSALLKAGAPLSPRGCAGLNALQLARRDDNAARFVPVSLDAKAECAREIQAYTMVKEAEEKEAGEEEEGDGAEEDDEEAAAAGAGAGDGSSEQEGRQFELWRNPELSINAMGEPFSAWTAQMCDGRWWAVYTKANRSGQRRMDKITSGKPKGYTEWHLVAERDLDDSSWDSDLDFNLLLSGGGMSATQARMATIDSK